MLGPQAFSATLSARRRPITNETPAAKVSVLTSQWIAAYAPEFPERPNAVFSGAGPRWWVETYDVPGVRCNT